MSNPLPPAAPRRAAPPPLPPDPAQQRRAILAALNVEVPRTELPPGYGLAMAGLATFLVVITAAYLALVAFLAYLLVWHVWQTTASFSHGPYFLFHVPMAPRGGLLLLSLINPVFFRPRRDEGAILTLVLEEQPLLFAFVKKLCSATGAPEPVAIEIDCEPNAA